VPAWRAPLDPLPTIVSVNGDDGPCPLSRRASNTLAEISMVKRRPEPEVHTLLFVLSVLAMRRGSGSAGQEPVTEAYEERRCQH
jgi:hypothetical protein